MYGCQLLTLRTEMMISVVTVKEREMPDFFLKNNTLFLILGV